MSESKKKEILQSDRYSDYMELYNNDENTVWEEFIADIFANMNDYSENYIDTVLNYWYNNDTSIGYNPSEYTQITDTGREYSLSDDIPYNKKRQ